MATIFPALYKNQIQWKPVNMNPQGTDTIGSEYPKFTLTGPYNTRRYSQGTDCKFILSGAMAECHIIRSSYKPDSTVYKLLSDEFLPPSSE